MSAHHECIEARVSSDQKILLERAAALQGRTLTEFVVASAQEAALRTIEEAQSIRLNAKDSQTFAQAMLNPREPSLRLRAAAERYLRKGTPAAPN